jgi:transcriptional regulator of arginine metabolism
MARMNALSNLGTVPGSKRDRQRAIRELVARQSVTSQEELAEQLRDRGFATTQATVSRDIAELGLVKVARGDRHVYVSPADLAAPPAPSDEHLRRIVADVPVQVGRSGLILLLVGAPGTAAVLAQAIDDSTMDEQEGTLAGDNTLLVLFRDEDRLERWLARFHAIQDGSAVTESLAAGRLDPPARPDTEAPR